MVVEAVCGANLPAAFTRFVGRRQEIAEIRRRLAGARLLTVTEPGGVGKTRLVLEAAATLARSFPGGVWLVNLAAAQDPSMVASTTAAALAVPDLGTKPLLEQLAAYLGGRQALIVLDNCEHLADACAHLAVSLLSAAPELRILATSRQMLGVAGEHVFVVRPLPQHDSAELLRDRATAIHEGLQPRPGAVPLSAGECVHGRSAAGPERWDRSRRGPGLQPPQRAVRLPLSRHGRPAVIDTARAGYPLPSRICHLTPTTTRSTVGDRRSIVHRRAERGLPLLRPGTRVKPGSVPQGRRRTRSPALRGEPSWHTG
ncbi:AAA family ATPase [Streptomyces puniciscabiei]